MPNFFYKNSHLSYEDHGDGYPIVFVGSYLWDRHMWAKQVSNLSKKYRCIVLELWDHGDSGHLPEKVVSLEDLATDVWQFTQHLNLDHFAFIGLSIGGMIGARLALQHPNAVSVLGLFNTSLKEEEEESLETFKPILEYVRKEKVMKRGIAEQIAMIMFCESTLTQHLDYIERWIDELSDPSPDRAAGIVAIGDALFFRKSILDQVNKIQIPVLCLTGQEDTIYPPSVAEEAAKVFSHGTCQIVDDAAHISVMEQPEIINEAIEKLLSSVA